VTQNNKWKGKTGGGRFGQKFLFLYFKYGSIILAYAVVSFVIFFYLLINFKATKIIYQYFRTKHNFSMLKSAASTYQNHFIFGKSIVDKFAVFAGRKDAYKLEVIGQEIYSDVVDDEKCGALILNSHVGSSEILGYLLKQNKKKFNALVYGGEAETIQKYRTESLGQQNINLIPVVDGFSHFFQIHFAAKNAELIGVAADRVYAGSKNIPCKFFGETAFFPLNPFQVAVKLNLPVIAFFVMILGVKKYKTYVVKISDEFINSDTPDMKAEKLLNKYVEALENILKLYPLQWFNFYDFWADNN